MRFDLLLVVSAVACVILASILFSKRPINPDLKKIIWLLFLLTITAMLISGFASFGIIKAKASVSCFL
jgi:hypothetical protein